MKGNEAYCINCGNKIVGGAIYCHKCGTRIESNMKTKNDIQEKQIQKKIGATYPQEKAEYLQPQQRHQQIDSGSKSFTSKTGYIIAGSIGALLIIGMILTPLILMNIFGSMRFVYLDTQTFMVDQTANFTSVDFIMKNDLGKIDVEYDETLDSLLTGTIVVYGKEQADLNKIQNIQITNTSSKFIVKFQSGDISHFFMNKDVFSYDISLTINPIAICNFTLEATTGRIEVNLSGGNNLTISNMHMQSTTGEISVRSGNAVNVSISRMNMQTTTGKNVLDFEGASEFTLQESLIIKATTGKIRVDLGNKTTMDMSSVDVTTSTGNIDLHYSNLLLTADIRWNIVATTGDITVSITQQIILSQNITQQWFIAASTGSIDIECDFSDEIGYMFDADTDTGNVSVPSDSVNYETDSNKFFFELKCSTGDISVNVN